MHDEAAEERIVRRHKSVQLLIVHGCLKLGKVPGHFQVNP
jgi:hypothetical protein